MPEDLAATTKDHPTLEITYEFLDHASSDVMIRDGPFVILRGKDFDVCYELIEDDFLCRQWYAVQRKIISHAGSADDRRGETE